jgi:serine/threonine protein kinase
LLGRGGRAEVRRAVDTRVGRPVAVMQLRAYLASDSTFQAWFRREAQSATGLNHPNIVAVYDTGEETDPQTGISIPYTVMELVEGPTLRDVLRDGRKILPERALELTQGVLDALSYLHLAGIIHRDIKPDRVMLTRIGGVKVMDFGLPWAVANTSVTTNEDAAVIGTAQYISPEQARGETVDARSDLYSVGCLLYELLVGRPPFVGESPVSVAYQHVREMPVPPSQLDPVITPGIDAVTLKALAKDPADRYQSAHEMKADLSRVLAGQTP